MMTTQPTDKLRDSAPIALLVEDEPQIRRFVRAALEEEGWHVHECPTMQRGLIDAGTRKPDLVAVSYTHLTLPTKA